MTASLTTLVTCLSYTSKKLSKVIADYEILCTQKENVGSLKYEEILEIVDTAIPKRFGIKYDSLNPTQQSQVLATEINHRVKLKSKEIRDLLFTIETSVFILWRHLEFYLQSHTSVNTTFSPCERYANETVVLLQQALFQTSPQVTNRLRSACHTVLEPVIKGLEAIPSVR
jgi:nuclear pore complex protein Nup205